MTNPYSDTLTSQAVGQQDALVNFFKHFYPDFTGEGSYSIKTYHGLLKNADVEVTYIRLDFGLNESHTILFETKLETEFRLACLNDSYDWVLEPNKNKHMVEAGYTSIVSELPIKLPRSAIFVATHNEELDRFTQEDFIVLDRQLERFRSDLQNKIAEATALAQKLAVLITNKDHDLYLSFKGVDNYKKLNIGLDRVYPLLPDSGSISLADTPINLDDWKDFNPIVQVNVRRILNISAQTNRLISRYRSLINGDPYIIKQFDDEVKVQLLASSHFMKQIYAFNGIDGAEVVNTVVDDILRKLSKVGGNIGLDLNEWVVWNYPEDGSAPIKVEDSELNFKETILNRYTTSFVEALYAALLKVYSPYLKPYSYREVVTEDDGIALGSIRPVK